MQLRIVIDVAEEQGLSGRIGRSGGPTDTTLAFDGWLDLLRCLERVLKPAGEHATGRPGAQSQHALSEQIVPHVRNVTPRTEPISGISPTRI